MQIYCLDNSDAACRSEDYPCGNRLAWQVSVIRTVSRSLLAPQQQQDTAHATSGDTGPKLAVVTSGGRPALSVPPTSDATALLGLDVACHDGEACQFLGALRLALLASRRSPAPRVLAFLGSQVDLPAEQCRQLSASFAAARVPLDVVLLCAEGELSADCMAALHLLTATAMYQAAAPPSGIAAAVAAATVARVGGTGRSVSASAAAADARSAAEAQAASSPMGQRLVSFPPPDLSLALWQQLESLLELLQPEGAQGRTSQSHTDDELADSGGGSRGVADPASGDGTIPGRGGGGMGLRPNGGRPPLPRPPRPRTGSGGGPTRPASSAAAAAQRSGLAPSGPLTGRSGARRGGVPVGGCRYESLDSLQHLSTDGFLRSWLPSYANIARVLPPSLLPASITAATPASSSQSLSGDGAAADGTSAPSSSSAESGPGPWSLSTEGSSRGGGAAGQLCYISVYRLQLPRWHKLLEVHAGCCTEMALPDGVTPPEQAPSSSPDRDATGATAPVSAAEAGGPSPLARMKLPEAPGQVPATAPGTLHAAAAASPPPPASPRSPPPPARPAVAVPRAPCPVAVSFSTRCSSAAAAATSPPSTSPRCRWVVPDPRRGTLSLIASVEDPGVVKLLWSERARPEGQPGSQRQYASIFPAAEEAGDGGVDPATAELELTLSPTRTQFSLVAAKGGAVLEVLSPRSVVHRPRQPPREDSPLGAAAAAAPSAPAPSSPGLAADAPGGGRDHPPHQQQQPQQRYFFWLQQDWVPQPEGSPDPTGAAATAGSGQGAAVGAGAGSDAGGSERSAGAGPVSRSGPVSLRGSRALAEHLQALLECPPEFDPHKHGTRVRCSNTPLQLGPLPLALVEEIMRASGRQLGPDGTVSTIALAARVGAAAGGSTAAAASDDRRTRQPQEGGASGPALSAPVAASAAMAVAAAARQRATAGRLHGGGGRADDGVCSLALSRSPSSAAPVQPSGGASRGAAASSAAAPASLPAQLPGRTGAPDVVRGFSRTTYSRPSTGGTATGNAATAVGLCPAPAGGGSGALRSGGSGECAPHAEESVVAVAGAAATALRSHPLDASDWVSECGSSAAGDSDDGEDGAEGVIASHRGDVDIGAFAASTNCDVSNRGAAEPVVGPAAAVASVRAETAATVAVAAAAARHSSSPLVAAAEPDGGGACQEEGSLLFELD